MADLIENYTCADASLPTSEALRSERWRYRPPSKGEEAARDVRVLLDTPTAKVHVISDFISPAECEAVEALAKPKLAAASVADDKGGSKFSPNRKAKQAGLGVEWGREGEASAEGEVARLSRRVFGYANEHTNFELNVDGQEDIMSIQYEGRGPDDAEPDRYMPHCDGECNGLPFREGNRVATMVMYCEVPERGGATNFAKSNLHVVPERGSATFFT